MPEKIGKEIKFINTREVSRVTGIPVATLTTWRSRGGGPPFYTPEGTNRVLYELDEVIKWARGDGQRRSTADRAINRDSSESFDCNESQAENPCSDENSQTITNDFKGSHGGGNQTHPLDGLNSDNGEA